jgi:hypothetical protein
MGQFDPRPFDDSSEDPFSSLPTLAPEIDLSEPPLSLKESASVDFDYATVPLLVIHFP